MKKRVVAIALAMSASLLLAGNNTYKYEVTPVMGGVLPEGNLNLENYFTYGLTMGINLKNNMFNQVEIGYLRSDNIKYENSNQKTDFNRYFIDLVKNYKLNNKTSLYSLVGVGYESLNNNQFDNKDSGFANYGLGLKYKVKENLFLKGEVKDEVKFSHGDNNLIYTVGVGIPFGKVAQETAPRKVVLPPVVMAPKVIQKVTPKKIIIKDSDGDGVIDAKDQCPNTPKGVKVNSVGCPLQITLKLNFGTNKAVIKPEYDKKIQEYAKYLVKMQKIYKITVKGYTDSIGNAKYNKKLSFLRANAVRDRLVSLGVNPEDIKACGCGEDDPLASNATKKGRSENRRVVIKLSK